MKKSEEYLAAHNILPTNPNALRIFKLVEKHPNYEFFFVKSHFGRENVAIEEIENVFKTIQDKNIKITKSVDQYIKYVVMNSFEQEVMMDGEKKKKMSFRAGENVTENFRFIYKENRKFVEQRTDFEAFSDEVRDAMTRLSANKIIQQFPAAGKKVVESLTDTEKKEFYFNLDTLLDTNTKYLVVAPIHFKIADQNSESGFRTVRFNKDQKLTTEQFNSVPTQFKKFLSKFTEKPLQAFIKKSARYRSKDALFADLNAALNSLSGDEEYRKTIELIEDTEGAILEGLNPETGIIVASTLNAEAYKRIGGDRTNHCIRNQSTFSSYQKFGGKQYLIVNSKLAATDDYRIIGLTIDGKGVVTNAHTKSDANIKPDISNLLKKWGIAQYVNPMSDDEIIEMLYVVIEDESIFSSEERSSMVTKYLPKLDESRYDKKKLLNLVRFTRNEKEQKNIIALSLENKNSSVQFLENYDYLSHSILKLVNDDKQAHEIVMNFVREFNDTVGLTKEDCMKMLLNKSKYVQPNRLIEIINKQKFVEYVGQYSFEQEEQILSALPQLYIYFLRDRNPNGKEIMLILESMYSYERRSDIRKIVLKKMRDHGNLKMITKAQLKENSLLDKIHEDEPEIANSITA